jgi:hypothetical protein
MPLNPNPYKPKKPGEGVDDYGNPISISPPANVSQYVAPDFNVPKSQTTPEISAPSNSVPITGNYLEDIKRAGQISRGEYTSPTVDQGGNPISPTLSTPTYSSGQSRTNFVIDFIGNTIDAVSLDYSNLKNVEEVFKSIVDPERSVVSNLDNTVYNTALEYVANNPLSTATILTGVTSLYSWGTKTVGTAFNVGSVPVVTEGATSVAVNTKTAKQSATLISQVLAKLKKPSYVLGAVGAMIGTYPWAEWALGEAKEGMVFNAGKAIETGDVALIADYLETSDEIFDQSVWDGLWRLTPGANIAYAFKQKADALQAQKKVNDAIVKDELIALTKNESDEEKSSRINQREKDQYQVNIDYYNNERKKMLIWENELRAAANAAQSEAERKLRLEEAEFWVSEKEKQRKLEAEDREAIAKFWLEYRKAVQKMNDESRPSKLNFGII